MQENVLGESRMMIPDCHKRLESALADLKSTLVDYIFHCYCLLSVGLALCISL